MTLVALLHYSFPVSVENVKNDAEGSIATECDITSDYVAPPEQ